MNQPRNQRQNFFLILMLGILSTVSPFSIDMYLPAFPEIATDLQTTLAKVAFSVSTYFIGFALGQILYGPLLDRFGRKRPMYAGLSVYVVASIGCMLSKTIDSLLIFRFFQALGGCVAGVASVSMVRDFFPSKEGARVFSLLVLILGVSPMLAPTFGSFVVAAWGWQSVFGFLAGIGLLVLAMIFFFLPEGHEPDTSVSLRFKPITQTFWSILREPQFYTYVLAGSFSFAGLFVYVAGSPSIFMDGFQVSAKVYGAIFAFLSVGMIGGSQLNLVLGKKFSNETILRTALMIQVVAGLIFFIGTITGGYGIEATIALLFIILSGSGISFPNAAAIALAPFSKNAGSASALMGFIQIGLGAVTSAGVGLLDVKGSLPTATVIMISSCIGLLILLFAKRSPALRDF